MSEVLLNAFFRQGEDLLDAGRLFVEGAGVLVGRGDPGLLWGRQLGVRVGSGQGLSLGL